MRRALIFLGALVVLVEAAISQSIEAPEKPELTVTITPNTARQSNGYVQGQIVLNVQLLSRHPFETLNLTMPQFSTAHIVELQRPRTRKVTSYAGQGHVFETALAIFPQTSGVLVIPPVTVVGHVEPVRDQELNFDLSSDPVEIKIAGISPHFDNPWWLVSGRVEIDESWSSPPEEIRVGEVIQRTVNLRAWGLAAEQLPEIKHSRTRGVKTSLAQSELKTERGPDGLIAHATYTWDLIAEPQQVAFIAPLSLDYWDPQEHRQKKAGLPGLRLEPLSEDSEKIAMALMQEAEGRRSQSNVIGLILIAILCLPIVLFAGAWIKTQVPTREDRRLRAALYGTPPEQRFTAMDRWLVDSGWTKDMFDRENTSRLALSNQLFGQEESPGPGPDALLSDALGFSRRLRSKRLFDRLFSFWYSS
ncbi:MAG: hypothetical protein AAF557_16625 [Pseudomonadota bacterium]